MKIIKILFIIMILLVTIIIFNTNISYADVSGLPDLSQYKPELNVGDNSITLIAKLLDVMTTIGVIITIVAVALIGFNMITGSAEEKAVSKEKFVGILIAGIIISSSTLIVQAIISIIEKM